MRSFSVLHQGFGPNQVSTATPQYSRVLSQHIKTTMHTGKPINACHRCGATSYRPVIARAPDGGMRPNGQYMCVRCKLLFTTLTQWRLGEQLKPAAS